LEGGHAARGSGDPIDDNAELGFAHQRQAMVDQQLRRRGIHDPRVLQVMARVPRHRFVPEESPDTQSDEPATVKPELVGAV